MVTVVPAVGTAAPSSHMTIGQVQTQIAALNSKAERITEAYDSANTQLAALKRKERVTNRLLAHDKAEMLAVQKRVAAGAAAAYKTGSLDPTLALVSTGTPQDVLNQSASLDEVARYEADQVSSADAAQRAVAAAQVVHNAQVAQQKKTLAAIASQKQQIQSLLGQQQALLSHLRAQQRAALAAQQQQTVQTAVSQRSSYHAPSATYNGPASGQAAAAVKYAYAQLGKPYVWGGAGPSSFDCSGLTMRAWGAAGVSLPHSAAGQQAMVHPVSLSALQPGDLIFSGSPAYHVTIYIGGGRVISAPHSGTVVQIQSIYNPTSAGRP
jgi:cell wall-associated NlpC family hydrolase